MIRAFKLAVYCATAVMSVLFLFGEIWPEGFIRLFTHDEVLIAQSIIPARIMLAVIFAVGFPMITGNFYTSIGMAPKAIFLSLTRQVLFLIPLIILLPLWFESMGIAPIWGVWWSWPISDTLSIIISAILINRDIRKFQIN
jgi:Na+-driven multidrug efflux pump